MTSEFGLGTYGGYEVLDYGKGATKLKVGKFCSLARGVKFILSGNHNPKAVSTFPFAAFPRFANEITALTPPEQIARGKGGIKVGNDVWIGYNAVILDGSEIGDGAIIGAGAVVAGKIPPYAIAVGNPVRIVKYRFTPDVVTHLLALQWWNWEEEKIKKYSHVLSSEDVASLFTIE